MGYYFITSSSDNPVTARPVLETVLEALRGGARIIQYREKRLPYREMLPIALGIRALTRKYNAMFIVNDHLDLAIAADADGVHVGQSDISYWMARAMLGPNKIIGVSASDLRQADYAIRSGADYISLSPILPTSTKIDGNRKPCGLETLEIMRSRMDFGDIPRVPIVAIGGIDRQNYKEVIRVGADWVCSIHDVLGHNNIAAKTQSLIAGSDAAAKKRIIYY